MRLRPRSITLITEGVINDFGQDEGPLRMCIAICQTLFDNPDDPAHVEDFYLWTRILTQVCEQRKIVFDVQQVCAELISDFWQNAFGMASHRKPLRTHSPRDPLSFDQRISDVDVFHARGLGIQLS